MTTSNPIRVAWLSGNRKAREAHLNKIRPTFGDHEELHIGSESSLNNLEDAVINSDLFGNKRLVIVNEIPQATGTRQQLVNDLRKLMDKVPSDCLLVFNGIDPDSQKALSGHVAKIGKVWAFDTTFNLSQAANWLVERLKDLGKHIELVDAEALVRCQPSEDGKTFDIDRLELVANKAASYVERRKNITAEDVVALDCGDGHSDIWGVFEAIDTCDVEKALLLVQRLLLSQDVSDFAYGFFPIAMWRFRLLTCLKDAISDGKSVREAVTAVCELRKLKQEGILGQMRFSDDGQAYGEWFVTNKVLTPGVLKGYTRTRMNRLMICLEAYCEECRYCTQPEQHLLLVESFLLVACEKLDDSIRRTLSKYFTGCNEI